MNEANRDELEDKIRALERQLVQVGTGDTDRIADMMSGRHQAWSHLLQAGRKEIDIERESQVSLYILSCGRYTGFAKGSYYPSIETSQV